MSQKKVSGMNFKVLWRECSVVLATDANRLKLIEATMICATPGLLYAALKSVYEGIVLASIDTASNPLYAFFAALAYGALLVLFSFLFTLPLFTGMLHMAQRMENGQESRLADVFVAFSSPRAYGRSLGISFAFGWKLALLVLLESLIFTAFDLLSDAIGIKLLCAALMLGVAVGWFFLSGFGFFWCYFLQKGLPNSEMRERMRPYSCSFALFYKLHFLPWMLLSLASFCILLLADTLPRMLIAYFRLCRKLNEWNEMEKSNDE